MFPFQKVLYPSCFPSSYPFWGLLNQARPSNLAVLNDTIMNDGALDLTLGSITGNRTMAHNNYGTVQYDDQIFRQVKTSPNLIERTTFNDENSNDDTVRQQSNQPAQIVGQSFEFSSQSIQPVQHAGQSLQYNQPTQAQDFTCQEPTYFPRLISPPTASISLRIQRPIIIDGLNIGYAHGCHKRFSPKGITLCVEYFTDLGFQTVRVLLPHHRQGRRGSATKATITWLSDNGYVFFTPSRKIKDTRLTCYSDRIILEHAYKCGGVVVSNDNFRDLYGEDEKFREVIESRQIMIMFINDEIIVPSDQYSHRYPSLSLSNILYY